MRCARAQQMMVAAVDHELVPRQQRALDRHLVRCAACQQDLATTTGLLRAVEHLPGERTVPAALEQTTFRRVRIAAAEEAERRASGRWTRWLTVPSLALATVTVAVFTIGLLRQVPDVPEQPRVAATPHPAEPRIASRTPSAPAATTARKTPAHVAEATQPPSEPPAELVASPDLFVELPILRNMEKLDHFEAIRTTTLDGQVPNG